MTDDDPMPASFVWTGDDGPEDMQKVPDGPALGNYPAQGVLSRGTIGSSLPWDRRATVGEKLARFLNDLAESVKGWH